MKIAEWVARLGEVWVEGQIAQLTRRPGIRTAFLVLRDPAADISISVTCPIAVVEGIAASDGARVIVRARPDYYAARGTLSLRATDIRLVGLGELLARLEQLKKQLHSEGLFDPARKKPLPFLPKCIGLITGRASAAERDVLENARRRWPMARFRIENVAVQGPTAASSVISAIARLDADPEVDVVIIARGGGSVEDLLPFSDEALCQTVAACDTPVISAIGHEPDSPLVDLVSDVRCSTPTDAGKRVVPDVNEEQHRLAVTRQRLRHITFAALDRETHRLEALRSRPALADPHQFIDKRREQVTALRERASRCLAHRLEAANADLAHTLARIVALSPAATLRRGYAIVQRKDHMVVRRHDDVRIGESVRVRLGNGTFTAVVDSTADGDD